jgi:hypothetical protein
MAKHRELGSLGQMLARFAVTARLEVRGKSR